MRPFGWCLMVLPLLAFLSTASADELVLQARSQKPAGAGFERTTREVHWPTEKTAIIVCDVWDYHHCLNAVRRLEEFGPRLDNVLTEARRRGVTIIHSPSDCMEAYADHPARKRAARTPMAAKLPPEIAAWCSRVPTEERAVYPIDQSDGGEDDDPDEHAEWAAKLKSLGRNPGMPWKKQSPMISIEAERDYISDKGDEVWSILEARGIEHVILVGVHTNMCVLGRPFGLRQMVRNGRDVVLMRDMTDCMYNPRRWPYVDHFTGCDLVISHVERYICPTITSDQILGGKAFRSQYDRRNEVDVMELPRSTPSPESFEKQWSSTTIPSTWADATAGKVTDYSGVAWFRCAVRIPQSAIGEKGFDLVCSGLAGGQAWLNGKALSAKSAGQSTTFHINPDHVVADDANLLVLRIERSEGGQGLASAPQFTSGDKQLSLAGRWQFRLGDDATWSNIPLPARFGASPDMLFEFAASKGSAAR